MNLSQRIGSVTLAELQAMVEQAATASGSVGGQVSLIVGEQRADFVYGLANAELRTSMTVDSIVQVGSVTKMFNAAVVMSLVDEGTLDLDAPVVTYLPELVLADAEAQRTVTLRHALSMSSGLDNPPHHEYRGDRALARYVELLRDVPLLFKPGQGFGYSNPGTCIAGLAAETVAGESWDALMQRRIFEPAKLRHAITRAEELPYHRVCVGHAPAHDGQAAKVLRPWYFGQAAAPAGTTLAASASDLASFGRLFINGGKAEDGTRVLSESAIQAMMTPTTSVPITVPQWGVGSNWGLGPNRAEWGSVAAWGHAGGTFSGGSQLVWFPERHAVLAFTTNTIAAFDVLTAHIFGRFSEAALGFSVPTFELPNASTPIQNAARFVGAYARTGLRYEISESGGSLHYKEINQGVGIPGEHLGVTISGELLALGGERFMLPVPGKSIGVLMAFYGDDGRGRAANMVVPMYAARRISE